MADAPSKPPTRMGVGLAGGGEESLALLRALDRRHLEYLNLQVVGVADPDPEAVGRREGERRGIYTTGDYRDLLRLEPLDLLIDLTGQVQVHQELLDHKPPHTGVLDPPASRMLGDLVTLLQERERENHLERAFAQTLTTATDEGIVVLDSDYRIQRINEQACHGAGTNADEARGQFCFQVLRQAVQPCQRPQTPCPMQETLATGRTAHAIQEHVTPDGETHYRDVTTYPLVNREGDVVQVMEIFRDITHALSERLDSRTRSIKEDLSKRVQEDKLIALGKLVASVAHEINNPIGSILNFTKLLLRSIQEAPPGPDDLVQYERWLTLTVAEAERCGQIVGNLLSFSRQQGVEAREMDLAALVDQIMQLTAHRMELTNVEVDSDLALGTLPVWGDPTQIQQCLTNLIFNAMEAMPDGGHMAIRGGLDPEKQEVWVEVRDTGEGIAPEHRDHIFEPFFSTKPDGKGVGLGLSMVYGIVREHGGDIVVQSTLGEGTTFRMTLPTSADRARREKTP